MSPHYFGDILLSPDIRFCQCDVYSQPKVFCFCFWFFYYFIYLFIYGCSGSWLLCEPFSSRREWGLVSSGSAWVSQHVTSLVAEHGL